jgi:NTP pyrophosphatase (non-canonical NTP hydrolase)
MASPSVKPDAAPAPAPAPPLATLDDLRERLRRFAAARDWDQFHSPKNLAMALIAEAAELVEHFQWLTEAQSAALAPEKRAAVAEELADVLVYTVRLADKLGIDLLAAAAGKMDRNEAKYPAARVRGSARKYDEY